MPAARNADTSFTIEAPASRAFSAISGLRVSMEIGTSSFPASLARTGPTRDHSTSAGTGSAPGRVDSPPRSITSAPSSTIRRARETAASGESYRPPSEKESGVTLRTPMIRVRSKTTSPVRCCHARGSATKPPSVAAYFPLCAGEGLYTPEG